MTVALTSSPSAIKFCFCSGVSSALSGCIFTIDMYSSTPLFPYLAMPLLLCCYWLQLRQPEVTRMYKPRPVFSPWPPSCSPVEEVNFADRAGFTEGEALKTSSAGDEIKIKTTKSDRDELVN